MTIEKIPDPDPISSFGAQITHMSRNWGWSLFLGIVSIILGIIAFQAPIASTVALTMTLGFVLLVSGLFHLIHAFQLRKSFGSGGRFFYALLALTSGVLMLRYPGAGMIAIAMMLAFYFFMGAFTKWVAAASLRPHPGWGWMSLSSVLSFALGVYILASFPISALWLPGALLGIDLVVFGISLIFAAGNLRQLHKTLLASSSEEKPKRFAA